MAAQDDRSLRALLREMTSKGLRSRNGKPLQASGLWHLLTNPFYAGFVRYEGELFAGQHDPLVGKETFDRVQNGLCSRRKCG